MNTVSKQIKNFIQLHTSDMGNEDYIVLMRELAGWATDQANIAEYLEESAPDLINEE